MKEQIVLASESQSTAKHTSRDLLAAIFRHRRIAIASLFGIVAAAILAPLLLPKYQSEMEVLVRRGRVDPVVTAEQDARPELTHDITDEELNSEAEMMQSPDILRRVVLSTGLDQRERGFLTSLTPEEKVQSAINKLRRHLSVEVVKKTNIVQAIYRDADRQQATKVTSTLAAFYMEKHAAALRPGGQSGFFEKQMEDAKAQLADSEAKLAAFNKEKDTVAPASERDLALQKMNEFIFMEAQGRASVRETQDRIISLEKLNKDVPQRITTTVKVADNPMLMEQMKSKLLNLTLQRNDLLARYQPTHRLVQDVDKQIADTRAAIAAEQSAPVKEESTDLNGANAWVRGELAKAQADLATYKATVAASQSMIERYKTLTQQLQTNALEEEDIQRNLKVRESNYLLYQQKLEEARISDALDKQRILNVSLVEAPTSAVLPTHPAWLYCLLGFVLATMLAAIVIWVAEFTDNTFRTPDEIRAYLDLPVLAALPRTGRVTLPGDLKLISQ